MDLRGKGTKDVEGVRDVNDLNDLRGERGERGERDVIQIQSHIPGMVWRVRVEVVGSALLRPGRWHSAEEFGSTLGRVAKNPKGMEALKQATPSGVGR
jgi:hypothetical protein